MNFDNKKFKVYIAFTFIIGWVLQIVASIFAIKGQMMLFAPVLSVTMFAPLVASFIAKAGNRRLKRILKCTLSAGLCLRY